MALSVPNTVHTSISRLGKDKEYVELPLYRGKYTKFHLYGAGDNIIVKENKSNKNTN